MPLIDDTHTIRAASFSAPSCPSSSVVIRSGAPRFTSITELQRSSSMRPSVLSRVMPALWTTMSAPPCSRARCEAIVRGASGSVTSSASSMPSPRSGTSRPTTCAPSRSQDGRDRGADAARRAGHERHAAVERPLPVAHRRRVRAAHAHDLARHVGRARREQEPQRRLDRVLGARLDQHQLAGGAAAHLLGDRAREALERALGDRLARRRAIAGRGAEHDHSPAALDPADGRAEECAQLTEVARAGDPGGVEHERLERVVLACGLGVPDGRVEPCAGRRAAQVVAQLGGRLGAGAREHARHRAGQPAARGGAEQHAAAYHRVAGRVPLELDGHG